MKSIERYAALGLALCALAACSPAAQREFDAAQWKANADESSVLRIKMVDDLTQKHPLVGMTREEVTTLLGRPTNTAKFGAWDMVYSLGATETVPVDFKWLLLDLEDERVRAFEIGGD